MNKCNHAETWCSNTRIIVVPNALVEHKQRFVSVEYSAQESDHFFFGALVTGLGIITPAWLVSSDIILSTVTICRTIFAGFVATVILSSNVVIIICFVCYVKTHILRVVNLGVFVAVVLEGLLRPLIVLVAVTVWSLSLRAVSSVVVMVVVSAPMILYMHPWSVTQLIIRPMMHPAIVVIWTIFALDSLRSLPTLYILGRLLLLLLAELSVTLLLLTICRL